MAREIKEIQKDIENIIKINEETIAENNKKEAMKKNLEEQKEEIMKELSLTSTDDLDKIIEQELEELENLITEAKRTQSGDKNEENPDDEWEL